MIVTTLNPLFDYHLSKLESAETLSVRTQFSIAQEQSLKGRKKYFGEVENILLNHVIAITKPLVSLSGHAYFSAVTIIF